MSCYTQNQMEGIIIIMNKIIILAGLYCVVSCSDEPAYREAPLLVCNSTVEEMSSCENDRECLSFGEDYRCFSFFDGRSHCIRACSNDEDCPVQPNTAPGNCAEAHKILQCPTGKFGETVPCVTGRR